MLTAIWSWLFRRHGEMTVSRACLEHHERHSSTRGVELPTWRSPKEIAAMHRQEQRASLTIVRREKRRRTA